MLGTNLFGRLFTSSNAKALLNAIHGNYTYRIDDRLDQLVYQQSSIAPCSIKSLPGDLAAP